MVLALALAAVAAVAVYMYSSSAQEGETAAQPTIVAPTSVPMDDVLVAVLDIAANTVVTDDMVTVKQVPVGDKNARALTAPEQAVGKVTTVTLAEGEQILTTRLADDVIDSLDESETFAYEVPVGKRAVSITYGEVIGAGGLVQPGDRVDVIGIFKVDFNPLATSETNGETPAASGDEKQFDAVTYVVQDVEVLAVAQALSPDELGNPEADSAEEPTPTPDPSATVVPGAAAADEGGAAVARPTAASVTLAVSPEEAQRLLLAVGSEGADLRLALRAPGDTATTSLLPAQEGDIPLADALDNVNQPLIPTDLVITDAEFTRRALSVGEVLDFTVTLKNVSTQNATITTADDAAPGFAYTEDIAYDALGFEGEQGTYRLGLNVEGAYPTQFPYRWGLGRDVKPGESIDVTGSVRVMNPTPGTQYWFGVILEGGEEPDTIIQDGMGAVDITVNPPSAAIVDAPTAELLSEPSDDGDVTAELKRGDRLTVVEAQGDWFRVQTSDQVEGWISVAAVEVVPPESAESAAGTPASQPEATPADT